MVVDVAEAGCRRCPAPLSVGFLKCPRWSTEPEAHRRLPLSGDLRLRLPMPTSIDSNWSGTNRPACRRSCTPFGDSKRRSIQRTVPLRSVLWPSAAPNRPAYVLLRYLLFGKSLSVPRCANSLK